jgi:hypothetical protein
MSIRRDSTSQTLRQRLRINAHKLQALPEPSETWTLSEVGIDADLHNWLTRTPVIETVDYERVPIKGCRQKSKRHVYQTDRDWYDYLQEILEQVDLMPCGHRGIRNPRGVEGYTCTNDDCDAIHSREIALAVLNGGTDEN